jgi:hypothetical protein
MLATNSDIANKVFVVKKINVRDNNTFFSIQKCMGKNVTRREGYSDTKMLLFCTYY